MPIPPVPLSKGAGDKEFALQMHHFAINGISKVPVTAYFAGLSTATFNVGRHTE